MSGSAKTSINLDELIPPYADVESALRMIESLGDAVAVDELCYLIGENERPIRLQDRKLLADFIRSNMMMKPRRGRPRHDFVTRVLKLDAVRHVRILKSRLKTEGRKVPHDDVVAWVAQKHGVDFETLNNNVRRSSNARKKCRNK